MMQFHDMLHLLYAVVVVPVVDAAHIERGVGGTIRFCSELDYDSHSITQLLVLGQCHEVPNSAAKGDQGSSIYVSSGLDGVLQ